MNPDDRHTFTREELEVLSRAYLDCRLTRLQEKELELVLMSCAVSSPIIDEARETMAVAAAFEKPQPSRKIKRAPAIRWMRWCAAAACFAFVATFAVRMNNAASSENSMAVVVYVDGRRLSGDQAEKMALETQSRCMAMLERTVSNAQAVRDESMKILNQSIQ